jgi:hypothetical protein
MRRSEFVTSTKSTGETELWIRWLDKQRRHAIEILDGLSDADLRRTVVPSGWSPIGMIGHLIHIENFWFRRVLKNDEAAPLELPPDIEFAVDPAIPVDDLFTLYRREIELANANIRATPLDAEPQWWPDYFADWRLDSLQQILLHTSTEIACHAGHMDIARELIDGRQWFVLDV